MGQQDNQTFASFESGSASSPFFAARPPRAAQETRLRRNPTQHRLLGTWSVLCVPPGLGIAPGQDPNERSILAGRRRQPRDHVNRNPIAAASGPRPDPPPPPSLSLSRVETNAHLNLHSILLFLHRSQGMLPVHLVLEAVQSSQDFLRVPREPRRKPSFGSAFALSGCKSTASWLISGVGSGLLPRLEHKRAGYGRRRG